MALAPTAAAFQTLAVEEAVKEEEAAEEEEAAKEATATADGLVLTPVVDPVTLGTNGTGRVDFVLRNPTDAVADVRDAVVLTTGDVEASEPEGAVGTLGPMASRRFGVEVWVGAGGGAGAVSIVIEYELPGAKDPSAAVAVADGTAQVTVREDTEAPVTVTLTAPDEPVVERGVRTAVAMVQNGGGMPITITGVEVVAPPNTDAAMRADPTTAGSLCPEPPEPEAGQETAQPPGAAAANDAASAAAVAGEHRVNYLVPSHGTRIIPIDLQRCGRALAAKGLLSVTVSGVHGEFASAQGTDESELGWSASATVEVATTSLGELALTGPLALASVLLIPGLTFLTGLYLSGWLLGAAVPGVNDADRTPLTDPRMVPIIFVVSAAILLAQHLLGIWSPLDGVDTINVLQLAVYPAGAALVLVLAVRAVQWVVQQMRSVHLQRRTVAPGDEPALVLRKLRRSGRSLIRPVIRERPDLLLLEEPREGRAAIVAPRIDVYVKEAKDRDDVLASLRMNTPTSVLSVVKSIDLQWRTLQDLDTPGERDDAAAGGERASLLELAQEQGEPGRNGK